jgi:antitoxin component YwqK of YwqJK toxin-antitoxin module
MQRITTRIILAAGLLAAWTNGLWAQTLLAPIAARMPADEEIEIETITDRYPSGNPRIQREVAMDLDFNYVNHGLFQMFDEAGNVTASGKFVAGLREGKWTRTYAANESPLFVQEPFKRFKAPFTSEADFENGTMQGTWTIVDGEDRKISEIILVDGLRDGTLTYYGPSGEKVRQIDFKAGVIDGFDRTFNDKGEVTGETKYVDGRQYVVKTDTYISTKKKAEGYYLYPRMTVTTRDDWWKPTLASVGQEDGEPVRHGAYRGWHVNGQMSAEGEYELGKPVGQFTWWHQNGQVSIRGGYANGKHSGEWQWWHPNGMRAAKGEYRDGIRVGRWLQWNEDGALASSVDHGDGNKELVETPSDSDTQDTTSASRARRTLTDR